MGSAQGLQCDSFPGSHIGAARIPNTVPIYSNEWAVVVGEGSVGDCGRGSAQAGDPKNSVRAWGYMDTRMKKMSMTAQRLRLPHNSCMHCHFDDSGTALPVHSPLFN